MTDPVTDFIQSERAALQDLAPPPHAARTWHLARQRQAASLRRLTMIAGWAVRFILALVATYALANRPAGAWFLVFLFLLFTWLTRGACAPAETRSIKE